MAFGDLSVVEVARYPTGVYASKTCLSANLAGTGIFCLPSMTK